MLATFFADGRGGFAGLCGFSSWFPLADELDLEISFSPDDAFEDLTVLQQLYTGRDDLPPIQMIGTPVLLEHCHDDEVIDIENGRCLLDVLSRLFIDFDWYDYKDGGHWFNEPQGVDDFVEFLRKQMWLTGRMCTREELRTNTLPLYDYD